MLVKTPTSGKKINLQMLLGALQFQIGGVFMEIGALQFQIGVVYV